MKVDKYDSVFFIGLIVLIGSVVGVLLLPGDFTPKLQFSFTTGLGLGTLGIWIAMSKTQKRKAK